MFHGPISWSSRRQNFVTLSTCEAEYVAMVNTAKQMIFLNNVLTCLSCPQTGVDYFSRTAETTASIRWCLDGLDQASALVRGIAAALLAPASDALVTAYASS